MTDMVFDSGALISIASTCMTPMLGYLSGKTPSTFFMPASVEYEAISRPLKIHRFELNAIRIKSVIENNWIKVYETTPKIKSLTDKINNIVNSIYSVRKHKLNILQLGELEAISLLTILEGGVLVIDERTTRMIIEEPHELKTLLEKRYKAPVNIDEAKLAEFQDLIPKISVVRSVDLVAQADALGYFESYFNRKMALEAALYAMKFAGCAVTFEEIEEYLSNQ